MVYDKFKQSVKRLLEIDDERREREEKKLIAKADGEIFEFFPDPTISIEAVRKAIERARYKTIVYAYKEETVVGEKVIVNEKYGGAIAEILFQSTIAGGVNNKAYSIQIICDGSDIYNDSWDGFSTVSNYLQDLSAFTDGTYYILTFNTIFFDESITIRVYNAESPTFKRIYIKSLRRLI